MAEDLKKALGARVRASRLAKGLTQERLAELVQKSVQTLSSIERGIYWPSAETLMALSGALGVPTPDLLAEGGARTQQREQKEFQALLLLRSLSERDLDVALGQLKVLAERGR